MNFKMDCPDCGYNHCVHDGKRSGYARCTNCNSATRHFIGVVEETVLIGSSYEMRVHDPNLSRGNRPRLEIKSGEDWWRDGAKFVDVYRMIDRENDRYREFIRDPETGEVLRDCDEPLSEHRN